MTRASAKHAALAAALALIAALATSCAQQPALSDISPVRIEPDAVSVPVTVSYPLPSTGAARLAPTPADADDSKMKHVWTSHDDLHAETAPADGSIARWDDKWYIVHDYSPHGLAFLALERGDLVRIDGHTVRIDGAVNEPRDSYSNEVRAQVGDDATVFQTCLGMTALHIAYGTEIEKGSPAADWSWDPEPAAAALFDELHAQERAQRL